MMRLTRTAFFSLGLWIILVLCITGLSYEEKNARSSTTPLRPTLAKAVICENIRDSEALNQGIVFSIAVGKISCFNQFDTVPAKIVVYHSWYHWDALVTKLKLTLQPPRWATYSSIQLREADKGAWRVEIADQEGHVYGILRFSITD
jgi:hypothetical protein